MKLPGLQIIDQVSKNLQVSIGRHLYAILGTYAQLEDFEVTYLPHLKGSSQGDAPLLVDLNHTLLSRIEDESLRNMVNTEARHPLATQDKLNHELDRLLASLQQSNYVLIMKNLEILFAYDLDLQYLRARAANENHIILLLPGMFIQDKVQLFTESRPVFWRTLPPQLVTENHLWEIQS